VPDPIYAFDRRLAEHFFEIVQLPRRAADFQLSVLVDDSNSGGIIASVLEPMQPVEDERNHFFGANIADNSAH
jgi:hypothetical protein